jgi:hypothetical protein
MICVPIFPEDHYPTTKMPRNGVFLLKPCRIPADARESPVPCGLFHGDGAKLRFRWRPGQ